jgi:hypothetical protein
VLLAGGFIVSTSLASELRSDVIAGDWNTNGVLVAAGPGEALSGFPVPDQSGGFFLVWVARPAGSTTPEVRVTRMFTSGTPDPHWPAEGVLLGANLGPIGAWGDHSGGLFVCVGRRAWRLTGGGALVTGWPSGGVLLAPATVGPFATGVDLNDRIWAIGTTDTTSCVDIDGEPRSCREWVSLHAVRLTHDGGYEPGWEPPGRLVSQMDGRSWALTPFLVAIPGGVAIVGWHQYAYSPTLNTVGLVHIHADGPVQFVSVEGEYSGFSSIGRVTWDVDAIGAAFINTGQSNLFSGVEKHVPSPAWPWPGWKYPGSYPYGYAQSVIRDDSGGAYLRSYIYRSSPEPSAPYVNHILSNGVGDPRWASGGRLLPPAAATSGAAYADTRDARGGYFGVWPQNNGTDADIYALEWLSDGTTPSGWDLNGTAVCLLPGSGQFAPRAASDAAGNMFVTWLDLRNGFAQVFGQKIGFDSPVPVTVQGANAEVSGSRVVVTWRLQGAVSMVVERSTDGAAWESVGDLRPGAESDLWTATDERPIAGSLSVYRLRDPASGWTGGEVSIRVPTDLPSPFVGLSPNPVASSSRVRFTLPAAAVLDFRVIDLLGRVVANRRVAGHPGGAGAFAWQALAQLRGGLYWLQVRPPEGEATATRIVVIR